jgi:alkanesulfonate monooxygenase SsuD/methylene tetrahydromethanopterin reductase-like flavin-dependent oxidoreductase (luciferase family)
MLDVAARHADVWHSFGNAEFLADRMRILDERAERAGRDPASIARAGSLSIEGEDGKWDDVRTAARAFHDAGIDYLVAGWPSGGRARVEEFARSVMPDLTAG